MTIKNLILIRAVQDQTPLMQGLVCLKGMLSVLRGDVESALREQPMNIGLSHYPVTFKLELYYVLFLTDQLYSHANIYRLRKNGKSIN